MRLTQAKLIVLGLLTSTMAWANTVDVKKSKVIWTGSKVVGSTHTGEVKLKSADLKFKKGEPVSGTITVDMSTITNSDLKDKKYNKKLVGHLMSDDFFGVKKHKTAVLDIKEIIKASDKFYLLKGQLKIKGISQDVTLKAEVEKDSTSMQTIKVALDFNRTKFGIRYGSGTFFSNLGDKMISDEVNLEVRIHINKDKRLASH